MKNKELDKLNFCENIILNAIKEVNNNGFIVKTYYEERINGIIIEYGLFLTNGIEETKIALWKLAE